MSFLCFPADGSEPVEIDNPRRALVFVERGYSVTDLDHVEPAPVKKAVKAVVKK